MPLRPRDTVYVISRLQSEISKIPGSDSWDARKLKDTGVALVGLVDRCEILKKPWPMYGLPRKPKDTRVALVGLVEKQQWDPFKAADWCFTLIVVKVEISRPQTGLYPPKHWNPINGSATIDGIPQLLRDAPVFGR